MMKNVIISLFVLGALLGFCLMSLHQVGAFSVHFLDVGQGDSVLLTMPSGERMLVDGGPNDVVIQRLSEVLPFYEDEIDYLVLTHPHADHLNGLIEVLKRYEVKGVFLTGADYHAAALDAFYELLDGVEVHFLDGGSDVFVGGVFLDVLYPQLGVIGQEFENINNSSITFRVLNARGEAFLMLSGDLETEGEEHLLDLNLSAEILKAGHHGSRTSSSLEFLEAVGPKELVISCGVDNRFSHPHAETLEKAAQLGLMVRRTDLEGTISYVWSSTR